MRDRRTGWIPHRLEVAQARSEAAFRVNTQIRCGRCDEEVAPGAAWCPHCGFDMSTGGATERKERIDQHPEPRLANAGQRLLIGMAVALVVLMLYLLLSLHSATTGIVFGVIAFDLAMLALGADLSVRGVLYAAPTMATALVFLTVK